MGGKILVLLAMALFIAACGAVPTCPTGQTKIGEQCCIDANANGQCDDAEQGQAPIVEVTPPPTATPPTPPVTPPPPPKEEPKEQPAAQSVEALLKQYQENVRSYRYVYGDHYYKIYGEKVKIELGKFVRPDGEHSANTIYLNVKNKSAVAYCEGDTPAAGRVCDAFERGPFPVSYSDYATQLPPLWLEQLQGGEVMKIVANAQTIGSVHTDRWEIALDGRIYSLWVVSGKGIPVRVVVTEGQTKTEYQYQDMSVNTVKESDFVPNPDVR